MVNYRKKKKKIILKNIKNTKGLLPKRWKDLIRMIKIYNARVLSLKRWKDLIKIIKT